MPARTLAQGLLNTSEAGLVDVAGSSDWVRPFGPPLSIGFCRRLRAEAAPLLPPDAPTGSRFIIMAAGRQPVMATSGRDWTAWRLRAGQLLSLLPSDICTGRAGLIGPAAYWWIALGEEPAALPGMSLPNGARLHAMLRDVGRRSFAASNQLLNALGRLSDFGPTAGALDDLALESAVQTLLVQLVRDAHAPPPPPLTLPLRRALRHAIVMVGREFVEPAQWDEVARGTGLTAPKLWQLFKQEVGLSPAEYLNARRVHRAMRLLRAGRLTNTQVAHEVGFSTSQYFSVVFRRLRGTTPTEFVARLISRD